MIAVVSHDAGGAEVLASYVARNRIECRLVLEGPAQGVFARRLGSVETVDLKHAIEECDALLCGTSWQSDLEWRALVAAKAAGRRTVTFLDHWGNYAERFVRGDQNVLPDEIWVGDETALRLARPLFVDTPVRLLPNPYFDDIRDQLAHYPTRVRGEGLAVLFLCEPLTEHGRRQFGDELHWGYTEFEALRYLVQNQAALGDRVTHLTIRPHPSEAAGKYEAIAAELGPFAKVGGDRPLLAEIMSADVVVGCQSMAMVIGLVAGKRVVAAIPPCGIPCALPQLEIEHLQQLIANSTEAPAASLFGQRT